MYICVVCNNKLHHAIELPEEHLFHVHNIIGERDSLIIMNDEAIEWEEFIIRTRPKK